MKSIFTLLLVVLCSATAVMAQRAHNIPTNIVAVFSKNYPNSGKVKWDREGDNCEASFKQAGVKNSVLYSAAGKVLETEVAIKVIELPAKARAYAEAKGKIKEASKITKANGSIMYEAEVRGKDLFFNTKGDYVENQDAANK